MKRLQEEVNGAFSFSASQSGFPDSAIVSPIWSTQNIHDVAQDNQGSKTYVPYAKGLSQGDLSKISKRNRGKKAGNQGR